MRYRRSLALILLVGFLGATAFAHANPPDPSWDIGIGIYDDADYDDVVLLLTSADAWSESEPVLIERPVLTVVGVVKAGGPARAESSILASSPSRAPPTS